MRLHRPGIPIIFFHVGDNRFAKIAILQATLASGESDIILLTDRLWDDLPESVQQIYIGEFSESALLFGQAYTHLGANPPWFERICYQRWFVIRDFARRKNVEKFCAFDTDIMLFSPVEIFAREFSGFAAGNWAWANYFSDIGALDSLCNYFHVVYGDPLLRDSLAAKNPEEGKPHLSDMVLLLELARSDKRLLDQSGFPAKGFDENITRDQTGMYVMSGGAKHLVFDSSGHPHAQRTDGTLVQFHFLHFQGTNKVLMESAAWTAWAARRGGRRALNPSLG